MGGDLDGGDVGGVVHAGGTRHRIDVFCGLACFLTYPHRPFSDWRPGVRLQKVCRSALLARLFLFSSTHFEDNSYCGSFWASVSTGNSSAICPRPRLAGRRSWSRLRGDLMTFCSLPSTLHFSFVKTFLRVADARPDRKTRQAVFASRMQMFHLESALQFALCGVRVMFDVQIWGWCWFWLSHCKIACYINGSHIAKV